MRDWDSAAVRTWLESRVIAARLDQVAAERGGRDRQDDCDKASAEEMICALAAKSRSEVSQAALLAELGDLLNRDEFVWPAVYSDIRFDRHARAFAKKLIRMVKANEGFGNVTHYQ
ncbi:MAG TPA: hypothetical protein VEZ48_06635 [Sphingomonadaceae bacterium]|nr:hypothetical protein [Sphingomonadaceae bacterium]